MFAYYLDLALRSLKRSPGLTALMVLTIAFGVAASMTAWSVLRAVSGDPIPWKSAQLYVPQLDMWGPGAQHGGPEPDNGPPDALDYNDALALMHDHRAKLQSPLYQIGPSVVPADRARHPINAGGHAVFGEFFPMADVPFQYGGGWSAADDQQRARVVVIGSKLNANVFDGGNSVGKMLNVDGHDYRVVGVLKDWNPQPRFYDVVNTGGFASDGEDLFMPFNTAIVMGLPNAGNINCDATPAPGFVGLQRSSCVWIAYLAQLDTTSAATSFRTYLQGLARTRYPNWTPRVSLRNLPDWLDHEHVVPSDTKVSLLIALGLLLVCLVNTAGLLLAKFLRRSAEIGVRRALGAPRAAIYAQFLTEGAVIGLAGGVLGLGLTGVGVASVGLVLPRDIASLARLDVPLLATTLVVAVLASLLAALYPTFRASRVQPAWQLKSN